MTSPTLFGACTILVALLGSACVTGEGYEDELEEDVGPGGGKEDSDTGRLSPPCEPGGTLSLSACALLGTIAYAEGTGPRYDLMFRHREFDSFDDHPRQTICYGRLCSTAAGRYQILEGTWDHIRGDLPDFSPASQDQAALRLIAGRGVRNVDAIDTLDELKAALNKLNREWASLPGSPYGQPTHSTAQLWTQFKRLRGI